MVSTIWFRNSFPYIAITIISIILLGYTLMKKKDRKLIVLYLSIAGLIYIFEFIVFVLLRSYEYYPGVLKNKYFDNVLGSIFSNAFTVPMTSVFVSGFDLRLMGKTVAVFLIIGIEELFLKIGIYEHYWWKTIYTTIGLYVLFYLSKKLYSLLKKELDKKEYFITLFFVNVTIYGSVSFILAGLLELFFYRVNWFENITRSHIAFATIYIIFISFMFTVLLTLRLNYKWYVVSMSATLLVDIVLLYSGILHLAPYWNVFYLIIIRVILLMLVIFIDKWAIELKHLN